MEGSDSTWRSLREHLHTTMVTPAHVARLRHELADFASWRGRSSVKSVIEKFQALERKATSLPRMHKNLCEMHWRTMLEYLKEGLPAECVVTLNLRPPTSLHAAYDAALRWARAHEHDAAPPPPAQLQFAQNEEVVGEEGMAGEVRRMEEGSERGHRARDREYPQHPSQTGPEGGVRGGAHGERRGMAPGWWRGAPRGRWRGRGAPYMARPATGRLQAADGNDPAMRYEEDEYGGQEVEVVAAGHKHGHSHRTPTDSVTAEGTKRPREESYTSDTRSLTSAPHTHSTYHPLPPTPGNGGRGSE